MRKSYISNSDEALNLHNGNQTAIVVGMKLKPNKAIWNTVKTHPKTDWFDEHGKPLFPPYQIGQEVYVRETIVCNALAGAIYKAGGKVYAGLDLSEHEYIGIDYLDKSYRGFIPLCKEKHSRTCFKIVGGEVVRVKDDIRYSNATKILEFDYSEGQQFKNYAADWDKYGSSQFQFGDYRDSWQSYIISRFGQSAWDNNYYIWYYKIEKI